MPLRWSSVTLRMVKIQLVRWTNCKE